MLYRSIIIFISLSCLVFSADYSFAASAVDSDPMIQLLQHLDPTNGSPPDLSGMAEGLGGARNMATIVDEPTTSVLLCQITCMIQGTIGYVAIACSVFVCGLLILMQKQTWQGGILTIVIISCFAYANTLAGIVMDSTSLTLFGMNINFSNMFSSLSSVFSVELNFSCSCAKDTGYPFPL